MADDGITVDLDGAQGLSIAFQTVAAEMQGRVAQHALRKASNVIKEAVVGEFMRVDRESTREAIWRNVVTRNKPKRFRVAGELETRLGILGGARSRSENEANPGGDTYYWRFAEFGTKHINAQENVVGAVKRKQQQFYNVFSSELEKAIDRAVIRAQREAAKAGGR